MDAITTSMQNTACSSQDTTHVLIADDTAEKTLKEYLSVDTTAVHANPDTQPYSEIGRGTYGIIFERPGTFEVVKRPIRPCTREQNPFDLWNDFTMHCFIQRVFKTYSKVHVPRCLQYVSEMNEGWWSAFRHDFEDLSQDRADLLITERIFPVPQPVRDALVDRFCPEKLREVSKASNKNKLCLIHPLLGRRKGNPTLRAMLNLRNYELCVDQMEQLEIDVDTIIDSMAESLAKLHWEVHVDAHDIEFVFGSAPTSMHYNLPSCKEIQKMRENSDVTPCASGMNAHGRSVHLWMLDFNRVSLIPNDDRFLEMALNGFVNQSKGYYPRPRFVNPHVADVKNWERFKEVYLETSKSVREGKNDNLPIEFLEAVENHYRKDRSVLYHGSHSSGEDGI